MATTDVIHPCIDLKEMFGHRFIIEKEEPYNRKTNDPWCYIIPCKNSAHIYPHGDSMLGFASKGCSSTVNAMRKLSFVVTAQIGEDGANLLFDVKHFGKLVKYMRPRRKRKASAQFVAMGTANLAKFHERRRAERAESGPPAGEKTVRGGKTAGRKPRAKKQR